MPRRIRVEVKPAGDYWMAVFDPELFPKGMSNLVRVSRLEDIRETVERVRPVWLKGRRIVLTGTCPVCLRSGRTLRKGWRIYRHGATADQEVRTVCPGSGRLMVGLEHREGL